MTDLYFRDKWVTSGHAKFLVQRIADSQNVDGLIGDYKLTLNQFERLCTPKRMPIGLRKFCAGYSIISTYNPHSQEMTLSPPYDDVSQIR